MMNFFSLVMFFHFNLFFLYFLHLFHFFTPPSNPFIWYFIHPVNKNSTIRARCDYHRTVIRLSHYCDSSLMSIHHITFQFFLQKSRHSINPNSSITTSYNHIPSSSISRYLLFTLFIFFTVWILPWTV